MIDLWVNHKLFISAATTDNDMPIRLKITDIKRVENINYQSHITAQNGDKYFMPYDRIETVMSKLHGINYI